MILNQIEITFQYLIRDRKQSKIIVSLMQELNDYF